MDGIAAVRGRDSAEIGGETEAAAEDRRTGEAGAKKGLPTPAGGARPLPVGERSQERAGCGEGRLGSSGLDRYHRAAHYLAGAQIYLRSNALSRAADVVKTGSWQKQAN